MSTLLRKHKLVLKNKGSKSELPLLSNETKLSPFTLPSITCAESVNTDMIPENRKKMSFEGFVHKPPSYSSYKKA